VEAPDYEAAVELLRVKGAKDVNKRAERTAANGLVISALNGNTAGVLLELNCETDFVAKTELFQQVAADIAQAALASAAGDRLAVLGLEVRPGQTAQELIDEAGASLKEKVEVGRFARFEGGYVTSYLHKSDPGLPPTLGVLVQMESEGHPRGRAAGRGGGRAQDRRADDPRGRQAGGGDRQDRRRPGECVPEGCRPGGAGLGEGPEEASQAAAGRARCPRAGVCPVPDRAGGLERPDPRPAAGPRRGKDAP